MSVIEGPQPGRDAPVCPKADSAGVLAI